jgi:hypothetical protein
MPGASSEPDSSSCTPIAVHHSSLHHSITLVNDSSPASFRSSSGASLVPRRCMGLPPLFGNYRDYYFGSCENLPRSRRPAMSGPTRATPRLRKTACRREHTTRNTPPSVDARASRVGVRLEQLTVRATSQIPPPRASPGRSGAKKLLALALQHRDVGRLPTRSAALIPRSHTSRNKLHPLF